MKTVTAIVLLLLAGMVQADDIARYTASVQGRLTIGPEGQVVAVELDDAAWMGDAVRDGYEQKIRAWRFEPIIENGQAITATAPMQLRLGAVRNDSKRTAHFAIESARFPDPEAEAKAAETFNKANLRKQPKYPADAARNGIGAVVVLVARVDAEGKPLEVAVEHLHLLGRNPGANDRRVADSFEHASRMAAKRWRLAVPEEGDLVRIPVRYTPPGYSQRRGGWEQVFPVERELPAWLVQTRAAEAPVLDLADNGSPALSKLRLLTPLDPAVEG